MPEGAMTSARVGFFVIGYRSDFSALTPLKRVRVAAPADIGQATSVETPCGAEGAKPMMEISNF